MTQGAPQDSCPDGGRTTEPLNWPTLTRYLDQNRLSLCFYVKTSIITICCKSMGMMRTLLLMTIFYRVCIHWGLWPDSNGLPEAHIERINTAGHWDKDQDLPLNIQFLSTGCGGAQAWLLQLSYNDELSNNPSPTTQDMATTKLSSQFRLMTPPNPKM